MAPPKSVAIVGGGIAGVTAAWKLSKLSQRDADLTIHLFDQGRRGVGGRASSRSAAAAAAAAGGDGDGDKGDCDDVPPLRFDHGCQFFRADTPRFREIVEGEWSPLVREWHGAFARSSPGMDPDAEFFGLPSTPPFYVGAEDGDGMRGLVRGVLDLATVAATTTAAGGSSSATKTSLRAFEGTRVARLERIGRSGRWRLHGTSGTAAFHDTSAETVAREGGPRPVGEAAGYDAVILTDVSSSFGGWHRASAGVPEGFARRVRERAGSRVPLFSAMVAFDGETGIPFDAASFDDGVVWFAAKSNAKPGMDGGSRECW